MQRRKLTKWAIGLAAATLCQLPAAAQDMSRKDLRRAVDAAILSDVSKDRQAERDARQAPYASPGYGSITTAKAASDACAADALSEVGSAARLLGKPVARTMSTGWEVEGSIAPGGDAGHVDFVCSVRNGSVSGVLLKDPS